MTTLHDDLNKLETAGLIALTKPEPELEYAFKHVFTQESVYQSLLHADRRRLHQQVGQTLEALLAPAAGRESEEGSREDITLLLAYHFEQSGDRDRAVKYLKMAGDQARLAYANQEARELYNRAIALLAADDYAGRWDILAEREQILDRLGEREQQATDLTLMQTLAELIEDDLRLAATHNRRAAYFDKISEYQAAAEAAEVGLQVARRSGHERLEAQSLNLLALAAWRRFDYPAVKKWANLALDALRVVGDPTNRIDSLLHLGRASYRLGQYDAALEYTRAAQELAAHTAGRDREALADLIIGWIYQRLGVYELADDHFQAALQTRRLIGDRYGEATALSHLGWLTCDRQKCQDGLRYCQEAVDISRLIGDRENEAYALSGMALNYEYGHQLEAAASTYQEALAIHREIGAVTLAIFDQAGLARLALQQPNQAAARSYIEAVVDWIQAGKAQQFWDPWIIYQTAYTVLTALGERDRGYQILDEAHALLQRRAAEIGNLDLRRSFLEKVAVNQEIEQLWRQKEGIEPF